MTKTKNGKRPTPSTLERLSLHRESLKQLGVQSGVKTGSYRPRSAGDSACCTCGPTPSAVHPTKQ